MIKHLKQIFKYGNEKEKSEEVKVDKNKKLQVATCVLLIEIAKADSEFTDNEQQEIISVMQKTFNLEKEYVDELLELSEGKIKNSISIYEFATTINENFSNDEKFELLKNLWRLIYIDEVLNMHEDHLIKRIGNTLNMEHRDIIAAKLIVKEENKKDL